MNVSNLIRTAWYSIKAYKFRIFLTMIGIIIGISSVSAIMAIGEGLSKQAVDSLDSSNLNTITVYYDAGFNAGEEGSEEPFKESDLNEIRSIDGVNKVEKNKEESFMQYNFENIRFFDKVGGSQILSVEDALNDSIEKGRFFTEEEKQGSSNKIVLSGSTAESLFGDIERSLGKAVNVKGSLLEVIGVRPKPNNSDINISFSTDYDASILPKKTFDDLYKTEDADAINNLSITLNNDADTKMTAEAIKDKLKEQHPDIAGEYMTSSNQEMIESVRSVFGQITNFVALVTGISLLVGGIGVMNIMYVSITERKREIGIRRAIGARPKNILMQFLVEAIFITGAGGIIGIIIGYLISKIAGQIMPFQPVMTASNFILAASISVLTGIIFGVIPAYKAAKLDPIKAIYQ